MKKDKLKIIGENIRALRESIGLSQEELAIKSDCHRNYIGMLERGERNPSVLRLISICQALEVDVSEILPKD